MAWIKDRTGKCLINLSFLEKVIIITRTHEIGFGNSYVTGIGKDGCKFDLYDEQYKNTEEYESAQDYFDSIYDYLQSCYAE